jgi:hypothetical protein
VVSYLTTNALPTIGCFAGGYALHTVTIEMNQFLAKTMGLPIDMWERLSSEDFKHSEMTRAQQTAVKNNISIQREIGRRFVNAALSAIREEWFFRSNLERIVLPALYSPFATHSIARLCISGLIFGGLHLNNINHIPEEVQEPLLSYKKQAVYGQGINTVFLGLACSLAQEKFGLVAAIFLHLAYNLHGIQYVFNISVRDLTNGVREIPLSFIFRHLAVQLLYMKNDIITGLGIFVECKVLIIASRVVIATGSFFIHALAKFG